MKLEKIKDHFTDKHNIEVYVKRDDLVHPIIGGNKWRKLKYNLEEAHKQNQKTILTFGGAFSNHIAAVALAGKENNFKTIGIIRGEKIFPLNKTLSFAESCGMQLHFISREEYRRKTAPDFIIELEKEFGNFYLIPEGGFNKLGMKGCTEIVKEIEINFDYICCACGTGTTLAGIALSLNPRQRAIGFSVMKNNFELEKNTEELIGSKLNNWQINHDYHFGGYAKITDELNGFVKIFSNSYSIPIEAIYTGKLFYGIFDLIKKSFFERGSTIVIVHTGGLQYRD